MLDEKDIIWKDTNKIHWNSNDFRRYGTHQKPSKYLLMLVVIILIFIGVFMASTAIIATPENNPVNCSVQPQQETIINNYYTINNITQDCIFEPNIVEYYKISESIRESRCYKDFLDDYSDTDTTKIKSIKIDVLCNKGESKGEIIGKVMIEKVNTDIKRKYGEIIKDDNPISITAISHIIRPITIINDTIWC